MTTEHMKDAAARSERLCINENTGVLPGLGFLTIAIGSHGAASPPTR